MACSQSAKKHLFIRIAWTSLFLHYFVSVCRVRVRVFLGDFGDTDAGCGGYCSRNTAGV